MKLLLSLVVVLFSSWSFLQADEILEANQSENPVAESQKKLDKISDRSNDYFSPGWDPSKYKSALGFSTSFGVASTLVYEAESNNRVLAYFLGYTNSADSYSQSNTTAISGAVATPTTTQTAVNSGQKTGGTLSLGFAYNSVVSRTKFLRVTWGWYLGADSTDSASYPTGQVAYASSSSTPGTTSITESAYGTVERKSALGFATGPVFDCYTYLRWFPQLAVGFQGGILYKPNLKTKTKTETVTRTFSVVNDVEQTPTAYSSSSSESVSETGPVGNTFSVAGQTFGFTASFVLRYVF